MKYEELRSVALPLIESGGLINLSREELSALAGFPAGSFAHVTGMSFSAFVEMLRLDGHTGPSVLVAPFRTSNQELRKAQIVKAGLDVAQEVGFANLSRVEISKRAGVSITILSRYFVNLANLADQVMALAIERCALDVIAEGLASQHPRAVGMPRELKEAAVDYILSR